MTTIEEFQFELLPSLAASDGQVFGIGSDISSNEDGFHPGSTDWATQNVQSEVTGHINFGRDVLNGPVWAWDLHVNRDECETAVETLSAFTTAWRALHIRQTPGLMIPLRYRLADRVRRIYGRPGKIEPGINNLILSGYTDVTCDFQAVDAFTYDDIDTSVTLTLGADEEGGGGGGFTFPLTFPVAAQISTSQIGHLAIGGDAPTNPRIRINGPVTNPSVSIDGWTLSLPDYEIPDGQYVDIDTRPWACSVLLNGVSSIAGKLGRRQNLPAAQLLPGSFDAEFSGFSSTGAATCNITWANAWNSI